MAVTVVVGGQYGSEGKGKLLSYLAESAGEKVAMVRCGGSNSGHTAAVGDRTMVLRQLPAGVLTPRCRLFLAAGMVLDVRLLRKELKQAQQYSPSSRLVIDREAIVLAAADAESERNGELSTFGSTLSGTGAATARKVLRRQGFRLARDVPSLRPYLGDVAIALNDLIDRDHEVLVEGTQGFGLSLHHSRVFPYVTSRDTTAAAFLSEAGLSPLLVSRIILVLRTFPIRVAGTSGPLKNEITWGEVGSRARYPHSVSEFTTVTKRLRRVGEFDWDLAAQAIAVNRPTSLAIHGIDYLSYDDYGKERWDDLSNVAKGFIGKVEHAYGVPVEFVFTGPLGNHVIDRRIEATTQATRNRRSLDKAS